MRVLIRNEGPPLPPKKRKKDWKTRQNLHAVQQAEQTEAIMEEY